MYGDEVCKPAYDQSSVLTTNFGNSPRHQTTREMDSDGHLDMRLGLFIEQR